ncbi:hypothetical protein SDC9_111833 [bioreactor metagenome]|uniref:Uncharacterized protein n=1 Tax=bioreactor metagenome TaxID=1076179 RepID=A0A645BK73_9ZZZZ
MLLNMFYIYLNTFLATPYFKSYIKSLARSSEILNKAVKYQEFLNNTFRNEMQFTDECRHILNFYTAKWRFAPIKVINQTKEKHLDRQQKKYDITYHTILRNKSDILNYLTSFIKLYSENIEEIDASYRLVILKYLKSLHKVLQDYPIKPIDGVFNIYHYIIDIKSDSISLVLCSTNRLSIEDDDTFSFTHELTLLTIHSELLSLEEYAALYNTSIETAKRWISKVKLHRAKMIGDKWFIPELQPKPYSGKYAVEYFWKELPASVKKNTHF